jgi:ABC-type bacteriocin/lantibiotic exporter with double-glycine peptidase domain
MTSIKKITNLLSKNQKKSTIFLIILVFIGMLFEMLSLGILLPFLSIVLKPNAADVYPMLKTFLKLIGNPTHIFFIFLCLISLVGIYILKTVFVIYSTWEQSKFSANLSASLSNQLFNGYLQLPYKFHLERNSAILIRNIQVEVSNFTGMTNSVIFLITEISVVCGVAFMLFIIEPIGALSVMLFLLISGYIFFKITKKKLTTWGEERQNYAGLMSQSLMQGLSGVKEVKLLGKEPFFLETFTNPNVSNTKILAKVQTLNQIPRLYLELLSIIALSFLIMIMVIQNKPTEFIMPTLGLFVAAAFRMIPSVNRIMSALQSISFTKAVINVFHTEFNLIKENSQIKNSKNDFHFKNEIILNNINFKYNTSTLEALKGISFIIPKGSCIGLIGQSGSGKSTLVDIILGLLDPSSGSISVDGIEINKNLRGWQNQVGYVPQSIYLVDDTLRNNIAFGVYESEINEGMLENAIFAAQLSDFIKTLPEGLDTKVGERGVRLSGGQRQRIGIARALYNNPQILIFDEATSALDNQTEIEFMQALKMLQGIKTMIIIAHRLTTVKDCDIIYKLKEGKIIQKGTLLEIE